MIKLLKRVPLPVWIISLAAVLRFVNLGSESLWYDETFTAWVSGRLSWANMWKAIINDVHPPLWYLIEFATTRLFGGSEIALRLPAAIFGTGSVFLVYQLAKTTGLPERVALIAAGLAAVLPSALYYSQDARMYPLLTASILTAAIALMRKNWPLYISSCVAALYTQNLAIFYVAALGLAALYLYRGQWKRIIQVHVAIGAAYTPWIPVLISQSASISNGFWLQPLTAAATLWPLVTMTISTRLGDLFQMHAYSVAIAATLIGLIASRKWLFKGRGIVVLAVVFVAPLLMIAFSFLWRNVYLPRVLLPSAHALMLVWGSIFALAVSKLNRRAFAAVFIPALAISVIAHYYPAAGRQDFRAWVQPVLEEFKEGDVIYNTGVSTAITLGYYLPGKPAMMRPHASDLNQSLTEEAKAAFGFDQSEDFSRYRRLWLLTYINPMSHADEYDSVKKMLTYPHRVIAFKENAWSQMGIYLVYLKGESSNAVR
jgi:uncharacterized membrane protein